jgi:hypothetical protein
MFGAAALEAYATVLGDGVAEGVVVGGRVVRGLGGVVGAPTRGGAPGAVGWACAHAEFGQAARRTSTSSPILPIAIEHLHLSIVPLH